MRIAIVGSGGVGGYFGGRLAAAGTEVTFIARGTHLDALRTRGLHEPARPRASSPRPCHDDPSTIGPVDIVFFTVKLSRHRIALALLPLTGPQTVTDAFQNGVRVSRR